MEALEVPELYLGTRSDEDTSDDGQLSSGMSSEQGMSRKPSFPRIDATYQPKKLMFHDLDDGGIGSFSRVNLRCQMDQKSDTITLEERNLETRVLVLFTGGTIGMEIRNNVYVPIPGALQRIIHDLPHLHDKSFANDHYADCHPRPFVMPKLKTTEKRIVYWMVEYEPLLDSCDMTYDDWIKIARDIKRYYYDYDAFVVLHGTDTMAYTAAALSFMLDSLGKPVVLTGSEMPVNDVLSDGRENLAGALIMAGSYDIPEVSIFFNRKLYRGNRTSKADCHGMEAFHSPNFNPLATMDISVKVNTEAIFRSFPPAPFNVHTKLNRNVASLLIFPSISIETVTSFLRAPMEGVVLHTYGAGNIPTRRLDILQAIKLAADAGIIVVNCSQCCRGKVSTDYASGKVVSDAGAISGSDMTAECALIKLSFVLGNKQWTYEQKRQAMQANLRGELTGSALSTITFKSRYSHLPAAVTQSITSLNETCESPNSELGQFVTFLRSSSKDDLDTMKRVLFPSMACTAAAGGDVQTLEMLTHDHKLLTPMEYAIAEGHLSVVEKLMEAGSHLTNHSGTIGRNMCLAVAQGQTNVVQCWIRAAADINSQDYDGRTPLHVACSRGLVSMVKLLLQKGAAPGFKDNFGRTPMDSARLCHNDQVVAILEDPTFTGRDSGIGLCQSVAAVSIHGKLSSRVQVPGTSSNNRCTVLEENSLFKNSS